MRPRPNIPQLLALMLCTAFSAAWAQDAGETVYRMEVGAGVGISYTIDDTNSKLYGNSHIGGQAILRYILSPRMALKAEVGYHKTGGSISDASRFYPADLTGESTEALAYEYSGSLYDLCALYELHFLPYGYETGYQGYKRITPYIQIGLGAAYATVDNGDNGLALSIPVGVGVKYKLSRRLNLGLDWRIHFTLSDNIDNLEDPLGIDTGGFRGKDHYGTTLVTLTYDISPKCATCNRDYY